MKTVLTQLLGREPKHSCEIENRGGLTAMRCTRYKSTVLSMLIFSLIAPASRSAAQNQASAQTQAQLAELHDSAAPTSDGSTTQTTKASENLPSAEIASELAALKARIEQLELLLKAKAAPSQSSTVMAGTLAHDGTLAMVGAVASAQSDGTSAAAPAPAPPEKPTPAEPFAYADWTWLNGNARTKDTVFDSKFFTPEIRFDTHFVSSFNHPKDDSLGGSTEIFRSNEVQLEQISIGGDFHWQNVRGRV